MRHSKIFRLSIAVLLVFLLLFSCKSVKKSKSSSSSTQSENTEQSSTARSTEEVITSRSRTIDSSLKEVSTGGLIIYPRGTFTVDADGRFTGEADSVRSTKKTVKEQIINEKDTVNQSVKKDSNISSTANSEKSAITEEADLDVEKKPSILHWIGVVIGLAIVIAMVIFWVKRSVGLR